MTGDTPRKEGDPIGDDVPDVGSVPAPEVAGGDSLGSLEGVPAPEAEAPFDFEARKFEIEDNFARRRTKYIAAVEEMFGPFGDGSNVGKGLARLNSTLESAQQKKASSSQVDRINLTREEELALALKSKMEEIAFEKEAAMIELKTQRHERRTKEIEEI